MASKGKQVDNIVKFFVTNLPEGCTPWELRCSLAGFGDISGTYVARKRDKQGSRFGFVSFSGVRDCQELLKLLGGVKMGTFKLKFNVARFALENTGIPAEKVGRDNQTGASSQFVNGANFKVRDVRSYREVVGSYGSGSGPGRQEEMQGVIEKTVVVPDRTGAFSYLFGLALVGKAKNLETLVDLDKLLRIAKVVVANIQFLGGLSMLISFHDDDSRKQFLDKKEVWSPWFTRLDPWSGQTLPFERVAWLKLCGIPLHLFQSDIMSQVGGMFGKVLFVPKSFEEDRDLSTVRVGILVGLPSRINDVVVLKWKNRSFRILVEEDLEDWIPDCLSRDPESEVGVSPEFSPIFGMEVSGGGEFQEDQGSASKGGTEKSPGVLDPNPHADQLPVHGEKNACDVHINEEREENLLSGQESPLSFKKGGPDFCGNFTSGSGESVGRPKRRIILGLRGVRSKANSPGNRSPEERRPNKRTRSLMEDDNPGFGFVGFTSKLEQGFG
ncbi:putative RNA recognition motif domain, nucleotide-binding alpha-beta plait domain superfamily [Helianthus annuus]|nr:putative RNA recognition motif domain, nucleotide-binding alpha-beta plait domain superfamily [Helianthus annuus]